jgi:2-polyprenyl-3-methyl-5-hydroxy-6-metoxy-1,4-benzoquinol methylase
MDMAEMYQGDYGRSTYGGKEEIQRAFYRIASLDPAKSDNNGRVKRIAEFASAHLTAPVAQKRAPTILDVGSGLGVFLHRMKEAGWECQALDTDPQFVDHARDVVGVKAMVADYLKTQSLGLYDVVTFNKVLEHVANPSEMLARSTSHLREGGFVYVEVPDAEAAALAGPNREEFFIEHHHIFSLASFALLAARSNFVVQAIERLREPSGKYTLRAFLVPHSWGKNERDNLS